MVTTPIYQIVLPDPGADEDAWAQILNDAFVELEANVAQTDGVAATAVQRAGDVMTGALTLNADPTFALHAATKQYADGRVAKIGDVMTGALTLNADPVNALHAATKQYVDGRVLKTGDTMTGVLRLPDGTATVPALTFSADTNVGIWRSGVDALSFTVGGVSRLTLSGTAFSSTLPVALPADPASALHAATKQYVDATTATAAGARVAKAGDTMTGALTLPANPTTALHAATKQYVDGRVLKTGDTMTGALTLPGSPVNPLEAATKGYVDGLVAGGGITEAYADARYVNLTGDTMTGNLVVSKASAQLILDTPTASYHGIVARVGGLNRWQIVPGDSGPETGGDVGTDFAIVRFNDAGASLGSALTIDRTTGAVAVSFSPTAGSHVARKDYVDTAVGLRVLKAGDTMTGPLLLPDGTAIAPAVSFSADTNVGIWRSGVDALSFTVGGVSRLTLNGTAFSSTLPVALPADPASALHAATKQYADATAATEAGARVAKAGDTMTGPLTIDTSVAGKLNLNSAAGVVRAINFTTAGLARFQIRTDNTAEGGANAGSDFTLLRYGDDGLAPAVGTSTVMFIERSTGAVGFNAGVAPGTRMHIAFQATESVTAGINLSLSNNSNISGNSAGIVFNAALGTVAPRATIRGQRNGNNGDFIIATGLSGVMTDTLTLTGVDRRAMFNTDTIGIATARTPATATAAGVQGQICWDSGFVYVCTATNTWKRAALSSW